jgi:hypothetical protein
VSEIRGFEGGEDADCSPLVVIPCSLVCDGQCHLMVDHDDGGDAFLQSIVSHIQDYMASQPTHRN